MNLPCEGLPSGEAEPTLAPARSAGEDLNPRKAFALPENHDCSLYYCKSICVPRNNYESPNDLNRDYITFHHRSICVDSLRPKAMFARR